MRSFYIRIPILFAVLLLMAASLVSAQGITGTIQGTVSDPGGAVLPGASVTASSPALVRGSVTVTTDAQGNFRIPGVQAGTYTATIELSGFATENVTNIVVPVGTTVRVAVILQLAGVEETITVMADSTPVRVKESGLGVPIDNRTIDSIPLKGREFTDLVELVPGVAKRPSSSDQGTAFTVFGERAIANSFLIDGNDANDLFTRTGGGVFRPGRDSRVQGLPGRVSRRVRTGLRRSDQHHYAFRDEPGRCSGLLLHPQRLSELVERRGSGSSRAQTYRGRRHPRGSDQNG